MFVIDDLKTHLLSNVSLQAPTGECIAIGGQSGSGKTVFLRALADLDQSQGSVKLDNVERRSMSPSQWRQKVRYCAAEPGFWAEKVTDHFCRPNKSLAILKSLDMPAEAIDWQIERLSTGEKQRVGLAMALADNPPVILADEPTSALDSETACLIEDLFRQRLKEGAIVFLVSHDREFAKRLADRHFTIANGEISEADR